jgi:hypothetical protein
MPQDGTGHTHYLLDSQKKLDPDPEPVIKGRPYYVIAEDPPANESREIV